MATWYSIPQQQDRRGGKGKREMLLAPGLASHFLIGQCCKYEYIVLRYAVSAISSADLKRTTTIPNQLSNDDNNVSFLLPHLTWYNTVMIIKKEKSDIYLLTFNIFVFMIMISRIRYFFHLSFQGII